MSKQGKKLARLLADAERRIAEYGFRKGDFGSQEDGYCAYGAVRAAIGPKTGRSEFTKSESAKVDEIEELLENLVDNVVSFNDAAATTAEDVRALLMDAASLALDGS